MKDVIIDKTALIKYPQIMSLGNHCAIDYNVYISVGLTTGDYVHIAPHVSIIGGGSSKLIMGHFSGISAGGRIICASDDFTKGLTNPMVPIAYRNVKSGDVLINDFCVVGTNSVVMSGVKMGIGSMLGAMSLLTKDTEPWGIYIGSPAKLVGYRDKESALKNAKKLGYNLNQQEA